MEFIKHVYRRNLILHYS